VPKIPVPTAEERVASIPADVLASFAQTAAERTEQPWQWKRGPHVIATPHGPDDRTPAFAIFWALDRVEGELWVVSGTLAIASRGPSVQGVSLRPWPLTESRDITSATLRAVQVGRIRDRALAALGGAAVFATTHAEALGPTLTEGYRRTSEHAAEPRARRPGRPKAPEVDEEYRQFALRYFELLEERGGQARGLLGALAERENATRNQMRDKVQRARDRGFIAHGRAAPGPRLYDLSKEEHDA
jgi:hypothetical protein